MEKKETSQTKLTKSARRRLRRKQAKIARQKAYEKDYPEIMKAVIATEKYQRERLIDTALEDHEDFSCLNFPDSFEIPDIVFIKKAQKDQKN